MTHRPGPRSTRRMVALLAGVAMLAACADDGDEEATPITTAVPEADDAALEPTTTDTPADTTTDTTTDTPTDTPANEYCALIEQIGDELPTDEQFDQLLAAAPAEIADNLAVVIEAVREDPEGAFSDPAVAENFPAIQAYESTTCGGEPPAEVDPDAQLVAVAATEYAFDLLTTPEAGAVSFVINNEGGELHELVLVRLVGDATLEEAFAADDPIAEGLVEEVGFAGPIPAGSEAVLNADLTDGRYVMVCFIPSPDGVPHADKGMVAEFTVG